MANRIVQKQFLFVCRGEGSSLLKPELGSILETSQDELPRVLWADDDEKMRAYVQALLEDRYVVETVTDGLSALASARKNLPDLILADVMMPRLDGVSLVSALRSGAETRNVPVILVSGRGGEALKLQSFEAGADDFIVKPFSARDLLARIKSHLELAVMRRASVAREEKLWSEIEFALEAGRLGHWQLDAVSGKMTCSARCRSMHGFAAAAELDNGKLLAAVHPDDRIRVSACFKDAIDSKADCEVEYRVVKPDGTITWLLARGRPISAASGLVRSISGVVLDVTRSKTAEEQQQRVNDELKHRVNNTLATVNAIARRTFHGEKAVEDCLTQFSGRLVGLARVNTLVTDHNWTGAPVADVIRLSLEPYTEGKHERAFIEGPHVVLPPRICLPLGMVFHEIGANAALHGALSNDIGVISVVWKIEESEGRRYLDLVWYEFGGPPVAPPRREGKGTAMIKQILTYELDATLRVEYRPKGVFQNLRLPTSS